jgi:hypothetical protein
MLLSQVTNEGSMEINQTKLLATCTSKHFEASVAMLRQEVSNYLARGICIVDHNIKPASCLLSQSLLYTVCKEIAKTRSTPFVSVEHFTNIPNMARVKMPLTVKAKPLSSHAMVIGQAKRPDRGGYSDYPIVFERKSYGIDIYYNGEKGREALQTWLMMCAEDNAMRFALGLPPKVRRDQSRDFG